MEPSTPDTWRPVDTADGSRTLFDARFGQTLHSSHGAITESRWVFLHGSGVAERLAEGLPTSVLEVGFGTGLNFLVTASHACVLGAEVGYTALDRTLPPASLVTQLGYERRLERPDLVQELWTRLSAAGAESAAGAAVDPEPPSHPGADANGAAGSTRLGIDLCGASLDLRLGEAMDAALAPGSCHAVYHDAFSPDANPELWSEPFLAKLAAALAPGGVLTTYTVKGAVRRALAALGLEVEKRPGPPNGKREMLWARAPVRARE